MLTTSDVAKIVGVSSRTISNYLEVPEFHEFLSQGALKDRPGQTRREFGEEDTLVLFTIRVMKGLGKSDEEIATELDNGVREQPPPSNYASLNSVAPVEYMQQIAIRDVEIQTWKAKYEYAAQEIEALKSERDAIQNRLSEEMVVRGNAEGQLQATAQLLRDMIKERDERIKHLEELLKNSKSP